MSQASSCGRRLARSTGSPRSTTTGFPARARARRPLRAESGRSGARPAIRFAARSRRTRLGNSWRLRTPLRRLPASLSSANCGQTAPAGPTAVRRFDVSARQRSERQPARFGKVVSWLALRSRTRSDASHELGAWKAVNRFSLMSATCTPARSPSAVGSWCSSCRDRSSSPMLSRWRSAFLASTCGFAKRPAASAVSCARPGPGAPVEHGDSSSASKSEWRWS
mmetsp:Transcript_48853/g.148148  ORF Transcript_48853/g.148148 Transcript_48853/m.148148 type:complete len:223 (-) Transcript_48853:247-915(-)